MEFCKDFVILRKMQIAKNPIKNPPVGDNNTPIPELKPENTGTPIIPSNKYEKIVINEQLNFKL